MVCETCKGTGKIELFTTVVDCECQSENLKIDGPPTGGTLSLLDEETGEFQQIGEVTAFEWGRLAVGVDPGEIIEARRQEARAVAAVYGIPPHLVHERKSG